MCFTSTSIGSWPFATLIIPPLQLSQSVSQSSAAYSNEHDMNGDHDSAAAALAFSELKHFPVYRGLKWTDGSIIISHAIADRATF